MKDILTHEDLVAVYAPEYLTEGEIFEQDNEFLYENDQIHTISTYLAESYDSEDLDTIFEMVEDLQSYMVEFFDFSNENEVNEAILMLELDSLVDILEDIYEGVGIVEDTYYDIMESVQFVYDSVGVIEEGILDNVKKGVRRLVPNKKTRSYIKKGVKDGAKAVGRGADKAINTVFNAVEKGSDFVQRSINRPTSPHDKYYADQHKWRVKADKKNEKQGVKAGSKKWHRREDALETLNRRLERKHKFKRPENRPPKTNGLNLLTKEEYDYLMEEAAVLSTLKVAELLSEVNLKTIARNIGGAAGRAYGRHVKAMKNLDAYNKERRQVLDQWKAQREQQTTNKNQPSSENQPYVSRGKKKNRPKPTIGSKKTKRGVYKPELSVAKGKRNPARKPEPVEQPTKKANTPFDVSSGAKLKSVTSVPKPQRKRARLKMKKPRVDTVKMGTGKTTDTSGSSSLKWSPESGKNLVPYNKKGKRSYGGAADSIGKAFKADPNKVARSKYD